MRSPRRMALLIATLVALPELAGAAGVVVDVSGFRADWGIVAEVVGERVTLTWPAGSGEVGRLVVLVGKGGNLFESLGLAEGPAGPAIEVIRDADLAATLTVGTRKGTDDRPPGMSPFNTFFDSPAARPHDVHPMMLTPTSARLTGKGGRATLAIEGLAAWRFAGRLEISVYSGARPVHVEAVLATARDGVAYLYDMGLATGSPSWQFAGWVDPRGESRWARADRGEPDASIPAKYRTIAVQADTDGGIGSLAAFPPPHSFFFPRDFTDNLATTWVGADHHGNRLLSGFGIRQPTTGGGRYSPWYNAPPNTEQRLGLFLAPSRGEYPTAIAEALKFTRGDRFADVPGHLTFSSHWHMALAVAAMKEKEKGGPRTTPDLVKMFKDMNVRAVHLAEFHGDGHPDDPGPVRLAEMSAMFEECRRLSDDRLLILPGEEANVHLGPVDRKIPPGHWLEFFPRPVAWTMKRSPTEPFVEDRAIPGVPSGKVYHVGNRDEMLRLLEVEKGLAWTAHARIKASNWTPDAYRDEPFFRSDRWLGAAWKAMPADLSRPRLGERTLDLLDAMNGWDAGPKNLLGEVDVFTIDRTHELYAHMNVNYLQLDTMPRYDDDWSPILDALRAGRFFVTTGEVLLPSIKLTPGPAPPLTVDLEWTFPLRFLEVVSADASGAIHHERIDLSDTPPFGRRSLTLHPHLAGRRWARVEAWDVAGDGAFSQPIAIPRVN